MISFFWQHWNGLHALASQWTDSQQGILCWGFKGVQEEIPSEEASTLQKWSVTFPAGQWTNPQLHLCHRLPHSYGFVPHLSKKLSKLPPVSQTIWPRWASRQFLSLPIVQTLLPVTFGYSLSSEVDVTGQLRRGKMLWRKSLTRLHKRTSMWPSRNSWNGTTGELQPEETTSTGTRVSCVYYQ